WQSFYDTLNNVKCVQGLPNVKDFPHSDSPSLIIIDDLMREADGRVVDLFTKGSHHRNLSVIHLTQNLFHQGKGARDVSKMFHLSRQLYPENPKFIQESYNDRTEKP
ncbi:hypothetical protein J437_LFUL014528, partial [Ladona fulva]